MFIDEHTGEKKQTKVAAPDPFRNKALGASASTSKQADERNDLGKNKLLSKSGWRFISIDQSHRAQTATCPTLLKTVARNARCASRRRRGRMLDTARVGACFSHEFSS